MILDLTPIENYLKEYNQEFENPIKPLDIIEVKNGVYLYYKQIFDSEIQHIQKFCKIYNLTFNIVHHHNTFYYHIY